MEADLQQPRQMKDRYIVRMPDGWRDAIKERAARNRRSMNSEILAALESVVGSAAGEGFGDTAPAANRTGALPGPNSTNG